MEDIIEYLEEILEVTGQDRIIDELDDKFDLDKDLGIYYKVDLENVLGCNEFKKLHNAKSLQEIYSGVREIIGKPYAPLKERENKFSGVLKSGQGECVEKGALFQIAMDSFRKVSNHPLYGNKSFYVVAFAKQKSEPSFDKHAFNIVNHGKNNFLVDVENPFENSLKDSFNEENGEVPYIVPIKGIGNSGEIIIPKRFASGRIYTF